MTSKRLFETKETKEGYTISWKGSIEAFNTWATSLTTATAAAKLGDGLLVCVVHGDIALVGESGPHYNGEGPRPQFTCGCPVAIGDHRRSELAIPLKAGAKWQRKEIYTLVGLTQGKGFPVAGSSWLPVTVEHPLSGLDPSHRAEQEELRWDFRHEIPKITALELTVECIKGHHHLVEKKTYKARGKLPCGMPMFDEQDQVVNLKRIIGAPPWFKHRKYDLPVSIWKTKGIQLALTCQNLLAQEKQMGNILVIHNRPGIPIHYINKTMIAIHDKMLTSSLQAEDIAAKNWCMVITTGAKPKFDHEPVWHKWADWCDVLTKTGGKLTVDHRGVQINPHPLTAVAMSQRRPGRSNKVAVLDTITKDVNYTHPFVDYYIDVEKMPSKGRYDALMVYSLERWELPQRLRQCAAGGRVISPGSIFGCCTAYNAAKQLATDHDLAYEEVAIVQSGVAYWEWNIPYDSSMVLTTFSGAAKGRNKGHFKHVIYVVKQLKDAPSFDKLGPDAGLDNSWIFAPGMDTIESARGTKLTWPGKWPGRELKFDLEWDKKWASLKPFKERINYF
jgi:hypothetical protein